MTINFKHTYLWLSLLLLNGCFDGEQDVTAYVADVKKTPPGKVEPLPVFKEYKSENYTAQGLRDPFSSSRSIPGAYVPPVQIEEGVAQKPRPDINRKREFLEGFPLDSFNMVGTLNKGKYYWGLVQNTDGKVYSVKVGDYIGQNSGRITKIDEDEIDINEVVPDGKGGWTQSTAVLPLKAQ